VALVTGSSSGIGAAIARALAGSGATVVVNSASSVAAGERLAAELPGASYIQADIGDPDQVDRLVAGAVERHGRLDILVNNAGVTEVIAHDDLEAVTEEVWSRILRVNLVGTWNVTRAAVPHLRARGDGVVVNITSIAGVRPVGSSVPYAVSKAALNHLTLLLANTLGPEIRVNAVAPGGSSTRRGRRTGKSSVTWCGSRRRCVAQDCRRT
jgi:ketoreductase RED2